MKKMPAIGSGYLLIIHPAGISFGKTIEHVQGTNWVVYGAVYTQERDKKFRNQSPSSAENGDHFWYADISLRNSNGKEEYKSVDLAHKAIEKWLGKPVKILKRDSKHELSYIVNFTGGYRKSLALLAEQKIQREKENAEYKARRGLK
jgi:hypothetical protein